MNCSGSGASFTRPGTITGGGMGSLESLEIFGNEVTTPIPRTTLHEINELKSTKPLEVESYYIGRMGAVRREEELALLL